MNQTTDSKDCLCKNCKWLNKRVGTSVPSYVKNVVGECENPNVPTKMCFSYGTLCNGKHFEQNK